VGDTTIAREGDFERALLASLGEGSTVEVRRGSAELTLNVPQLERNDAVALAADIAFATDENEQSTAVAVRAGTAAAEAGMRDGDVLVRIGETPVNDWKALQEEIKQAKSGEPLEIAIQRRTPSGGMEYLRVVARPVPHSEPVYGFGLLEAMYTYQAASPLEAVRLGVKSTWKFTRDSWETLRGIFRGSVSSEVMGGIIAIGTVSYDWASMGLARLFFFLCMLSINLAFINVLPIPVLDGGHLFFLIVEKIKGSPVSERVQGYSQMVGLVMIVSLIIYVTYNDIRRLLEL
jgi:regulator of sigma E protease